MEFEQAAAILMQTGQWIMDHHMTWGNSGNMSLRLNEQEILVTASGTRFDRLTPGDFTRCVLSDGAWTGPKPSKELPCHLGIYRSAPWAQAAIHVSPFYTTLAASSDLTIPNDLFVENMYYLARMAQVDYAPPGSASLAEQIQRAAEEANVILMRNHGVILYDVSMAEAVCAVEVLENSCRMAVEAARSGIAFRPVPRDQVERFLRSGYRPPRPWQK